MAQKAEGCATQPTQSDETLPHPLAP